jgi:hypothetical protein
VAIFIAMETTCSKCGLNPPYNRYSKQCLECKKKYNYEWRKQKGVTEHEKVKMQNYYYSNRERLIKYATDYNQSNPDKVKVYRSKPSDKKKKMSRIYSLLHNVLKSKDKTKNSKTEELLGYTAKKLRDHLNNFNSDWDGMHIDHKIPVDWFDDNTPLHIINHLDNLWLVESKYNLEKQARWCNFPSKEYLEIAKQYLISYDITGTNSNISEEKL